MKPYIKSSILRQLRNNGKVVAGMYPVVDDAANLNVDDGRFFATNTLFQPVARVQGRVPVANNPSYNLPAQVVVHQGDSYTLVDKPMSLPCRVAQVGRGRLVWVGDKSEYHRMSESRRVPIWSKERKHVVVSINESVYIYRAAGFLSQQGTFVSSPSLQGTRMLVLSPNMRAIFAISITTNMATFQGLVAYGSHQGTDPVRYTLCSVDSSGFRIYPVRGLDARDAQLGGENCPIPGVPIASRVVNANGLQYKDCGINSTLLSRLLKKNHRAFNDAVRIGQGLSAIQHPEGVSASTSLSLNWESSFGLLGICEYGLFTLSPLAPRPESDLSARLVIAGRDPIDVGASSPHNSLHSDGMFLGALNLLDVTQLAEENP